MNAGMARPSSRRILGPYVLKIRAILGLDAVCVAIGDGQSLREPLGFVINTRGPTGLTFPNRIPSGDEPADHVDFGGGGQQVD